MMRLIQLCALALMLSYVCAVCAASYNLGDFRLAPIDDPWRVDFQGGPDQLSARDFEKRIRTVAAAGNWSVVNPTDGRMELMKVVRDQHMMSLEVTYDTRGYRIRYLQSANLLYREQTRSGIALRAIHRNYNVWVKDLVVRINSDLGVPVQTTVGFAPLEKIEAVPFLKEKGRNAYKEFLSLPTPRAFAIAPNGAWASRYLSSITSQADVVENALAACNRPGKGECKLYAVDTRVVWQVKTAATRVSAALTGADLAQHLERFTRIEANVTSSFPFTLSVSADGNAERVCKDCPVPTGYGTMAAKPDEGLVCFQWEKITYPDSGCFRVVPSGKSGFELRGTNRERTIRYALEP